MKQTYILSSILLGLSASAASVGCQDSFKDCENTRTCPRPGDGDGDGDTATGGGDGDGDTGGGDGDGDTGGTGGVVGAGGGDGDGDGDSTGGMGGDPNNACLLCEEGEYCTSELECVECLNDGHCDDAAPVCDPATYTCVGCIDETDCEDPALPMCNGQECVAGCESPTDCERFDDTPVCDSEGSGECVGCLPEGDDRTADDDVCGTGVCNPVTLTCDNTLTQADKDVCEACIADSECLDGQNCIPLQYTGGVEPVELGGFCMKLAPGCSPPYQAGAINRVSLSGTPSTDYCGLAEELTTCAAIKDLQDGRDCASADECGSGSGEGRCEIVNLGATTQCTYACTGANAECPTAFPCDGTVGGEYCGG